MRVWLHDQVRRFALWLLAWVDACPICGAPWLEHHCPYEVTTTLIATDRACGVCGLPLPVSAIRTHDGKWRCLAHKGL